MDHLDLGRNILDRLVSEMGEWARV